MSPDAPRPILQVGQLQACELVEVWRSSKALTPLDRCRDWVVLDTGSAAAFDTLPWAAQDPPQACWVYIRRPQPALDHPPGDSWGAASGWVKVSWSVHAYACVEPAVSWLHPVSAL